MAFRPDGGPRIESREENKDVLVNRQGEPILDAEQELVTYERYIDAVHTIAQAINKQAAQLLKNRDQRVFESHGTEFMAANDAATLQTDTSDFNEMSFNQRADMVESASVKHMLALAELVKKDQGADLIERYAVQAAQGQRSMEALNERIDFAFQEQQEPLQLQREIIAKAWQEAGEGGISKAVVRAAKLKMETLGLPTPPELILWHDVDANLTLDEKHNEGTPGLRQTKLVYQRHGRPGNELPVFSTIYGEMQSQPGVAGAWGRQLFREIGVNASKMNLLPQVVETFQYAERHNIDMRILTRNIRLVGEGLGLFLGIPPEKAFGRTITDHVTTDKPKVVLDALLAQPHSLHVIVDDGDSTILENIRKGTFPDGTHIQQYAFLIGRSPSTQTRKIFELDKLMQERGLPHGVHGDDYSSVLEVLEAYNDFCQSVQTE